MHREAIRTYEADISLARKYCVDEMNKIHTYNLRKWYLDIETTSGRDYKQINAITTMVEHALDNTNEPQNNLF